MLAWRFCGGWEPERIPYAAAYYGIADVEQLTALMVTIRERVDAWHDAQARAREASHGIPAARA